MGRRECILNTEQINKLREIILTLGSELIDKGNTPYQWSEELRTQYESALEIFDSYLD